MAFVAWQAFARRSLALGSVRRFAFQWMPWARIDRATFQYHYYAAIPFLILPSPTSSPSWHGPSTRTWALARMAAAFAILGPALDVAVQGATVCFVRVTAVNPGSAGLLAGNPGDIV